MSGSALAAVLQRDRAVVLAALGLVVALAWAYLLLADHPTVAQRIAMTRAWERRHATSAAQSL